MTVIREDITATCGTPRGAAINTGPTAAWETFAISGGDDATGNDPFAEMLDSFGDGFIAFDFEWRITYCNQGGAAHHGLAPREMIGQVAWALPGLRDDTELRTFVERAAALGAAVDAEVPSEIHRGRWYYLRAFPLQGGFGLISRDVTDGRRAEEQQRLLMNELNHRVKNTLATVQSLARQTLRDDVPMRVARQVLTERLMALSAAHNVLTRDRWESADLQDIVREAVRPWHEPGGARIVTTGDSLRIAPNVALALSLALHELATNAQKYGALSVLRGRVDLSWTRPTADHAASVLTWRESGGPPVSRPATQGFGSRLLRSLGAELGAAAEVEYDPLGLVCRLRAPAA
ncbi:HWE histidine kinase domain-containing protein [Phenylobacterium sp.]|uniref:sensor histidine kinase n=1 Tax=Phenylobacterium sp. TaxID=1871053 RepID=UPI00301D8A2C